MDLCKIYRKKYMLQREKEIQINCMAILNGFIISGVSRSESEIGKLYLHRAG